MAMNGAHFVKQLLRQEVVPSMGCTEPAAIAYAAAAASAMVDGELKQVHIVADMGTFKNTLAVGLPGTEYRGPNIAAGVGALVAREDMGLSVFEAATPLLYEHARSLANDNRILVTSDATARGVFIRAAIEKTGGRAGILIEGRHDRITARFLNGTAVPIQKSEDTHCDIQDSEIRLRLYSPKAILKLLEHLDEEDLNFVKKGVEMNLELAHCSIENGFGLGYGKAMWQLSEETGDRSARVKSMVAAGVEARMAGIPMPVTTSGGSGNSGITVTLGTWAGVEAFKITDESLIWRGVALAHLFNIALKARIGRVGPLCGGTASSSTAVGCALAWMLGGDDEAIDLVVRYMVDSLTGNICDGAKPACALKISTGVGAALDAARLAASGVLRVGNDGMGGSTAEMAFERLVKLTRTGYVNTDIAITSILQDGLTGT